MAGQSQASLRELSWCRLKASDKKQSKHNDGQSPELS
jgi:hypothetical protein